MVGLIEAEWRIYVSKLTITDSDNGLVGSEPLSESMLEYC